MFTTDLVNLYNRNIFKTSLYIYIFQDEKCRLMRNLSLSMRLTDLFNSSSISRGDHALGGLFNFIIIYILFIFASKRKLKDQAFILELKDTPHKSSVLYRLG